MKFINKNNVIAIDFDTNENTIHIICKEINLHIHAEDSYDELYKNIINQINENIEFIILPEMFECENNLCNKEKRVLN